MGFGSLENLSVLGPGGVSQTFQSSQSWVPFPYKASGVFLAFLACVHVLVYVDFQAAILSRALLQLSPLLSASISSRIYTRGAVTPKVTGC